MAGSASAVKYMDLAIRAARSAGEVIRERFPQAAGVKADLQIRHKGEIDLVTEVDTECEHLIRKLLLEEFPEHSILGEEEGGSRQTAAAVWLVDPLDGTRGFAHGYPMVSVSIALELEGELAIGVVYDPLRDELFQAAKGQGAFLNGLPIHVSDKTTVKQGLLASGFPYQLASIDSAPLFAMFRDFVLAGGGIRRGGSAAIDFCYLACGRLDGYWEFFLQPWDCAAGSLIVQEAGGRVTDLEGKPFSVRRPHLLASNGLLHKEMLAIAAPRMPEMLPLLG